ncbi:MAG: mrx1 [Dehalococcoidia bacterium]|nr:mrx1 [Dehalococcoidia bacterium]
MNESQIVMYGTTWCPDCTRAKRFLDQREIQYKWINVDADQEGLQLVLRINHGKRVVPTILFPDGSVLVEPSNAELAQKLVK